MNVKSIIKKVALVLAGITAVTAVGFGAKAIYDRAKDDLKTITPTFEVGNLGTDGKYVNDESTLYTKEAFGCYGLQVKPDFDSTVNYQVYYYDILDNFVSSSAVLSNGFSDEAPINGAYARLVITPREDEDNKISLVERVTYPSQLTIKVKKEQDIENRFFVFNGRVMQVSYSLEELLFINNLSLDSKTLQWGNNTSYTTTALNALKVDSGSSINFDKTILGDTYSDCFCKVFEFDDFPSSSSFVNVTLFIDGLSSLVLDNSTKYLIIGVSTNNTSLSWDINSLSLLPSCFSVLK